MKRLIFDIETSPLVAYTWRVGYKISIPHDNIIKLNKIICISYKWQDKDKISTLVWDKKQCDKQMLNDFVNVVKAADELVAHNGDNYDIKWLRTRCAFHNIDFPDKIESYDTLKKARKQFRLNSNKLDYMAKFFGVGEKMETGGFKLWLDVLSDDAEALKKMVKYCEQDVLILQKVFEKVYKYSEVNIHTGVSYGDHRWTCDKCGSQQINSNGSRTLKSGTVRYRLRCVSCNSSRTVPPTVYKSFLIWQYEKNKKSDNNN